MSRQPSDIPTIRPEIQRVDASVIAAARTLPSATLHEAGGRIGVLPSAIKPVAPAFRICGPAVTVHSPGGDNLWIHRALYVAEPGDVLVVHVNGAYDFGYWGEIMSSLTDVQRIMATVRADYKQYFVTRFFTGMRTGEVHGLKWKYVDFDLRVIRVRETFVLGEDEYTKTDGSQRDIQMSQPVFEALQEQYKATGKVSEYVFCNLLGTPLDNKNFTDRIWYPLLRHLGLEQRRPYQMRHTAATLWLASGEAPEWIARQLGHTSTEMLFRVYSRYVPNLTRQDGSAMERLLASRLSTGALVPLEEAGQGGFAGARTMYVPADEVPPLPIPKPRGIHGARSHTRSNRKPDDHNVIDSDAYGGNEPQPPPWRMRVSGSRPVHRPA